MMGVNNGFWNRTSIRVLSVFLCVVGVSLTGNAATLPGWKSAPYSQSGNRTSFGLGNSSSQITPPPGYQYAGNYGIPNQAVQGTTFGLTAEGKVFIPNKAGYSDGVMYPYRYEAKLSVADVAQAIIPFIGGPLGVACALACPQLAGMLGQAKLRFSPVDNQTVEWNAQTEVACEPGACMEYRLESVTPIGPWSSSKGAACQAWAALTPDYKFVRITRDDHLAECLFNWTYNGYTYLDTQRGSFASRQGSGGAGADNWQPAKIEDIRRQMDATFPSGKTVNNIQPGVLNEILSKGGDIPLPSPADITITGPSTIPGPSTTTTNSDGSRTVETTSRNFTTSGNSITNITNTTNTTIYNTDNSVRSSTSSTTSPSGSEATKEEEKDECVEGSNKVACAEFDEPEGEIPKTTKNVTFTPQDLPIQAGQCPADVSMSFRSAGGIGAQKIVDWRGFCDMAIPLRAIVMALASIMAFFIVMPGGRVE